MSYQPTSAFEARKRNAHWRVVRFVSNASRPLVLKCSKTLNGSNYFANIAKEANKITKIKNEKNSMEKKNKKKKIHESAGMCDAWGPGRIIDQLFYPRISWQ